MTIEQELAHKLELAKEPKILGYAVELLPASPEFNPKGDFFSGYVQNLKFKLDVANQDANNFKYTLIKHPTLKTKRESYCYDLELAHLIQQIFTLYNKTTRLCYVLAVVKPTAEQLFLVPI